MLTPPSWIFVSRPYASRERGSAFRSTLWMMRAALDASHRPTDLQQAEDRPQKPPPDTSREVGVLRQEANRRAPPDLIVIQTSWREMASAVLAGMAGVLIDDGIHRPDPRSRQRRTDRGSGENNV